MKKIFISLLIMSISSAYPYLQEGLYPDCSYIEVTADGWRMHKNQEGRILSMISPESHDTKTGKYSFDKFGNLIPYTDCLSDDIVENKIIQKAKENESEVEIKIELDFSKFKFNPSLSVNGGASMPIGDNLSYEMGYHYGINVNPNFPGFLNNLSFSFTGMNLANEDADLSSLTSNGFFANYKLPIKKIYLLGGIGMLNQEGAMMNGEIASGSDTAFKGEFGINLSKKIDLYTQGYYTSTFLGKEQTSTFILFGLKYNF